ncbi:uncharacterized protein LOC130895668 isoform X3 [Diorhabda carinulata]|uniref:uncharacterized protein LOC130895668 isoform X3 n=1 Tax=Diorhabda carinulata TaxID=1163345 RepID=UPI0025A02100|nr:uncharacterized protein LOC130895668 isoform X3 [Diorhabda carinulata]
MFTMDVVAIAYLGAVVLILIILVVIIRVKCRVPQEPATAQTTINTHQQEDIYNISSQVQNQEQWPTHNAHLSLDHITLMNQMNKSAYDDAPPSYDEVMKASLQNNGGTSTSELPPPPPPSHAVIVVPPTTTTTSQ